MIEFPGSDGRPLLARVQDGPGDPVICLPGGPLRNPDYFGDLGGLARYRQLAILELPHRRVDELVADVDALRAHLGLDRFDLLAHSAGGSLALRYAAAHPDRLRRLALVTPSTQAAGVEGSEEQFKAALARRSGAAWYSEAMAAVGRWFSGEQSPEVELGAAPFFYGRWDAAARAHAETERVQMPADAETIYYADGALDPEGTRAALAELRAEVLVLAGEFDPGPDLTTAEQLASLMPHASVAVQPGAGHFPWLDDPARFVDIVGSFLTG